MNRKLMLILVIIGTLLALVFPTLAIISLFGEVKVDEENEALIMLEETQNSIPKISKSNDKAKIDLDKINNEEKVLEIEDDDVPLGLDSNDDSDDKKDSKNSKPKRVKGKDILVDFKTHRDEIENDKTITFEIVSQDGKNLFFNTYEELELFINEKDDYEKTIKLNDDDKLIRYIYLSLKSEDDIVSETKDKDKEKEKNN